MKTESDANVGISQTEKCRKYRKTDNKSRKKYLSFFKLLEKLFSSRPTTCLTKIIGTVQCRPLIPFACTLRVRWVHAAFSVAHFLNNQSEHSVNATLTQGERIGDRECTPPSSCVNATWTQSEHRTCNMY